MKSKIITIHFNNRNNKINYKIKISLNNKIKTINKIWKDSKKLIKYKKIRILIKFQINIIKINNKAIMIKTSNNNNNIRTIINNFSSNNINPNYTIKSSLFNKINNNQANNFIKINKIINNLIMNNRLI